MLRFPLPLVALTFALAVVAASHSPIGKCDAEGAPAAGIVEFTWGDPSATFYVDDRNAVLGNGVWIYQEANGIWTSQGPGAHRGDTTDHNLQRSNGCGYPGCGPEAVTCVDPIDADPDVLIF